MNVFKRTLAVVCFALAPAFAQAGPAAAPTTVGECRDLACFGQLAVREKLADGTIKLPLAMYSQEECDRLDGIVPAASCKVIQRHHFAPIGKGWVLSGETRDYDWHRLADFGAVYVGELFYDRQTINAVAVATRAECELLNAAMEPAGQVPCFHMDALPRHFTEQQVLDSLGR